MRSRAVSTLIGIAAILSLGYALLWQWVDLAGPVSPNLILFMRLMDPHKALRLIEPGESSSQLIIAAGILGGTLYGVVRLWLWWRARGGTGSGLLLAAALVGIVPLVAQLWLLGFSVLGLPNPLLPRLIRFSPIASSYGWLLHPVALLLLALGLLRSRMVPPWLSCVGLAAAPVLTLALAPGGDSLSWLGPLNLSGHSDAYLLGVSLEGAFLVSLGVFVIFEAWQGPRAAVEQADQADGHKVDC